MEINKDIVVNAVKKAFETNGIKAIQGKNVDDLVKSISDSIIKSLGESVDVKSVGDGLMKGLKSFTSKK